MASLLMERIFRSTPNRVLTPRTEWLPVVQLRHFSLTCAVYIEDCGGWWLSGYHSSVAEHWLHKPGVLGLIPVTAGLFTFLYFCLITSKFLFKTLQSAALLLSASLSGISHTKWIMLIKISHCQSYNYTSTLVMFPAPA